MKPNSSLLLAFVLLYALPMTGGGLRKTIHLKPGTNSVSISDAVIRGDRNWYYLRASAGQTLSISITSLEHNAGYSIYEPGYRIQKHFDYEEVEGKPIIEADETTPSWKGILRKSGRYLIEVGSSRGNAGYDLVISVK